MTSVQTVDVVTIGESMVLFQPLTEGSVRYAPLFTKSVAGSESNVAIGLTRLGKRVRWISRLGVDPFGDFILSTLTGEGVDTSLVVRDSEAPTAVYFKEFTGSGDPSVYYYRNFSAASKLSPEDIQLSWFDGARHLHVTGITPALGENALGIVREAMKLARARGLTISFDPNLRRKLWRESEARLAILSLIPLCDIFLPGMDEVEFLIGKRTLDDSGSELLQMGVKVAVIKLGDKGSCAFYSGGSVSSPALEVQRVVDTVGAGDAFAAGFLSVLLEEEQFISEENLRNRLGDALSRANVMGAIAIQCKGDWEGIPDLTSLKNMIEGHPIARR